MVKLSKGGAYLINGTETVSYTHLYDNMPSDICRRSYAGTENNRHKYMIHMIRQVDNMRSDLIYKISGVYKWK